MSRPTSQQEESRAEIAHNLARLIFEAKREKIREDPAFKLKSVDEQDELLSFKTDTYTKMDKMIENIKKYREEYTGNRVAVFLKEKTQKKAHFEEDEDTMESAESIVRQQV